MERHALPPADTSMIDPAIDRPARRPLRTSAAGWLRWSLVVALLGAGVAACGGSDDPVADPTTTVAELAALSPGSRYVALGSSFAAGPGVPPSRDACFGSMANYPNLVAEELELDLEDVSCSGATTLHVYAEPQDGNPPQVEAVDADTRLVTVTIGGNDVSYIATAFLCAPPESCISQVDRAAIDAAFETLPDRLSAMTDAIREQAPEATIVLVTYPRLFGDDRCDRIGLDEEETAVVRDIGDRLQRVFHDVADTEGLVLVDPYAESGHDLCASDAQRWVEGAGGGPTGLAFHPNALAHRAMADMVLEALAPS